MRKQVYIDEELNDGLRRRMSPSIMTTTCTEPDAPREPVISETVTRLRYDAGLARVTAFRVLLDQAVAQGLLVVRDSDERLRRSAFGVLEKLEFDSLLTTKSRGS